MLAALVTVLRVIFFFALYFVVCMFVVVLALQDWPVGAQMALAFGAPVLLVSAQERRRRKRRRMREHLQAAQYQPLAENSQVGPRILPPIPVTRFANSSPQAAEPQWDEMQVGRVERDGEGAPYARSEWHVVGATAPKMQGQAELEARRETDQASNAGEVIGPTTLIDAPISEARRARLKRIEELRQAQKQRNLGYPNLRGDDRWTAQDSCARADETGSRPVAAAGPAIFEDEPISEARRARLKRIEELRQAQVERNLERLKPRGDEHVDAQENCTRSAEARQGWVPRGEQVDLAGRSIGGMIYFGTPLRLGGDGYYTKSRPFIDPALPVATVGADKESRPIPYWPSYSEISPICRATYLDWLADGRQDASYNPGYMFLYFYGLERRFFIDQAPEEEKIEILEEVRRLAAIYARDGSAQFYLGEFIQIAQIAVRDPAASEPVFDFQGWELPFGVKAAIGTKIAQGEPLGWDWTLSWLICHPEHPMRTASKRCAEEFRALFRLRFEERFPEGLKVTKPRKTLDARYQAASQEFHADLSPRLDGKPLPDISGVRKPVEIAQEIADEVTEALERFSRYLGRNPEGRGSLEAHALLPPELRELFPSKQLEALRAWASERVAAGGIVPAVEMIARLEDKRPDKLTKAQLTGAADTLARIGFGLAPDPRFALRAPKIDEPLVIFALEAPVENLEDVSAAYRLALLELALGAVVALADGVVSEPERQALLARIARADQISEPERLQLKANMEWHLAVPPDIALLRRKLKEAGPDMQSALRAALVAAAHADGLIQPEEVAQIEKLYRTLGLDPGLVYSDIHAGDDVPVRVRPSSAGAPGEPIPDQASAPRRALDPALIAVIRSDTARVSSVLGEIFGAPGEEQEEASQPESAASGGKDPVIKGLDPAASALVLEIINCTHLTEEAFDAACKRHGLMPAGALEAINEWAFETHGEALLDAYDGYDVSPQIAAAVRGQFAKEEENVDA